MNRSAVIVPTRIREARESRGLSMAELSELIGVTSQAISQYEKGITTPSIFVLKKMAECLNFSVAFFYKNKNNLRCSNSAVYFRAMASTSKKLKSAYAYRVEWANDIYDYLKQYIDFNPVNIPDISEYLSGEQIELEDIEKVANIVRRYWQIGRGPIDNLIDLLEDNGVVVCNTKFANRKIDAFSQWYDGTPYIFLGNNKISAVRARFDIAHELGHLLLHPFLTQDEVYQKSVLDRIELEANYFASALLMPSDTIAPEIIHNSIEYLCILKEKWKVSIAALIMRAKQLEIFSENQSSYLYRTMSAKNIRVQEPLDDVIEKETPKLLSQAIDLLIDNNIIQPKDFLEELCLAEDDLISICSLNEKFFDENKFIKDKERMFLKVIK